MTRSSGVPASGLHAFRSRISSRRLGASLEAAGVRTFVVDLRDVGDKAGFITAWRSAIGAPSWTGSNWDALEESMRDLSWDRAERYAVIVTGGGGGVARSDPEAWHTMLDILRDAAGEWDARGVSMAILVRGSPTARSQSPSMCADRLRRAPRSGPDPR